MDNPDDKTTIINVKSVNVSAWEAGKAAANRSGETMGNWLSRAILQLANLERGERVIPPGNPANQPALPSRPQVDFHEVAAVLMAMKEAGLPVQKRVGSQVNALLYDKLRDAKPERAGEGRGRVLELTQG